MKGFTLFEIMILGAIIAVTVAPFVMLPLSCYAKWEHSGMASSWGFIKGCLVEIEPGRWMPDDRVREIEIPRKKP